MFSTNRLTSKTPIMPIGTLRLSGFSPREAPIAGRAVAMIVESRFCMNIAQATISETTSWRDRGVISRLFVIPAKAGIQRSRIRLLALDPRFRGGDDYT